MPLTSSDASSIVGPSESLARANPADQSALDVEVLFSRVLVWHPQNGRVLHVSSSFLLDCLNFRDEVEAVQSTK